MRNPIKEIMQTQYKYILVATVIAVIVFAIGAAAITSLGYMVQDKQVSYTEFTVSDKYVSEDTGHYYIIMDDHNQTFSINNDDVGVDLFNRLQIGKHYHVVTQKNDADQMVRIIQVYNETH